MSALTVTNKKWILKNRPTSVFDPEKDVELVEEMLDLAAEVPAGKLVLKIEMLGVDAFVRTMMNPQAYHGSTPTATVVPAFGYGVVVQSGEGAPAVGTRMHGMVLAQLYGTYDTTRLKVLPERKGLPPCACLGMLGLTTGITAYVGVNSVLSPPKKGETVVVSAAAGAVGTYACQLCKATGARVIGIAGGTTKCAFLVEQVGLDGAVDYKSQSSTVGEQLDELCPDGIDFFFDNVGGDVLVDVLDRVKFGSRIVICGGIASYNSEKKATGPSNYLKLAERGALMKGFVVTQYPEGIQKGIDEMQFLHWRGDVKAFETRTQGLETYPQALNGLFTGASTGKTMVEVVPESLAALEQELLQV
jgi:NADPH-dependent curcumin reductase CurA